MMKVKIIKCSDNKFWYTKRVGEIYDVIDYKNAISYELVGGDNYILKSDCEIVKEEVEKSCSNCKYKEFPFDHIDCKDCRYKGLGEYKGWQPKEQQEDKLLKVQIVSNIYSNKNLKIGDIYEVYQEDKTFNYYNVINNEKVKHVFLEDCSLVEQDKPKKLKLRMSAKKLHTFREVICRGCMNEVIGKVCTKECEFNIMNYVKGEK